MEGAVYESLLARICLILAVTSDFKSPGVRASMVSSQSSAPRTSPVQDPALPIYQIYSYPLC